MLITSTEHLARSSGRVTVRWVGSYACIVRFAVFIICGEFIGSAQFVLRIVLTALSVYVNRGLVRVVFLSTWHNGITNNTVFNKIICNY